MDTEPDLSIPNCQRIAAELNGSILAAALLRPNIKGLAPRDALDHAAHLAELRTLKLLDDANEPTRLGRRVRGLL